MLITRDLVNRSQREASDENQWSNHAFNNNRTALTTIFLYLESEEIITKVPTKGITLKKKKARKHQYYETEQFERVRKVMLKDDTLVYFATKLIYYLCIQAELAKTDADRFIDIPDELMDELSWIRKKLPTRIFCRRLGWQNQHVLQ